MEQILNTIERSNVELTKEDFVSDQMVKWCAGCGAHAILAAVANVFPKIGYKKENFMLVSGIGCSSRFPYYVNTYGFHGIHGRAYAIAWVKKKSIKPPKIIKIEMTNVEMKGLCFFMLPFANKRPINPPIMSITPKIFTSIKVVTTLDKSINTPNKKAINPLIINGQR
jgi:diacylglycerol kinase family enzyme